MTMEQDRPSVEDVVNELVELEKEMRDDGVDLGYDDTLANDGGKEDGKGFWYVFFDLFLNLAFIILFVVLIRTFLISPFHVFGASMCDTLNFIDGECKTGYGEYIIVNKAGYLEVGGWAIGEPSAGDIVVFHPPKDEDQFFIKRIIGVPGDEIAIENGDVYRNGFLLDEPYLNEKNAGNTTVRGSRQRVEFEVPRDRYFVMGDNRLHSTDSRSCFGARSNTCTTTSLDTFLPKENIAGRAWITLWPPSKMRVLPNDEF